MNRSVYSLVLSDDVVEAVDRPGYQQKNTSRSALINQILAGSGFLCNTRDADGGNFSPRWKR